MNNPHDEELLRRHRKLQEQYQGKYLSWVDETAGSFFGVPSPAEQARMQHDRDLRYIEVLLQYGDITIEQGKQHLQDPSYIHVMQQIAAPYITSLERFLALGIFTPASCQSAISQLLGEKLLTIADLTPELRTLFFSKHEKSAYKPQVCVQPDSFFTYQQTPAVISVYNVGDCPITVKLDITFHPKPVTKLAEVTVLKDDKVETLLVDAATLCGYPIVYSDKTPVVDDLQLGDLSSYTQTAGSLGTTSDEPLICPRDHHTMSDPCRRDYCSCSCAFCKQSCGETT